METASTNTLSVPLLLIAAGLLLLFGVIAIGAIVLIARRCTASKTNKTKQINEIEEVDPWEEAGKRVKGDFNELQ